MRSLYVPEAQGGLPPGPHVLYVLGTRTSLGRTVRAAHRGTPSSGWLVITPGAPRGVPWQPRPLRLAGCHPYVGWLSPQVLPEACRGAAVTRALPSECEPLWRVTSPP